MKLSRWKVITVGIAALALALAVISPAVGGLSLKSLVKKEVRKQLRNKTGPQGPQGPQGQQGQQGQPGSSNVTVVRNTMTVGPASSNDTFADCPAGQRATGGGTEFNGGGTGSSDKVLDSMPVNASHTLTNGTPSGTVPTGWWGHLTTSGAAQTAFVWVLCVPE
jgi:hypothetical protein